MSNRKQKGFSLIEILVAMCLMSIMVLGLAKLQFVSMQNNNQAFIISKATEQLNTMAILIKISNSKYNSFILNWNKDNQLLLPAGYGEIDKNGNKYNIYVFWGTGKNNLWKCDKAIDTNKGCLQLETSI